MKAWRAVKAGAVSNSLASGVGSLLDWAVVSALKDWINGVLMSIFVKKIISTQETDLE